MRNILVGIVIVLIGIVILMWGSYYDGKPLIENAKSFGQALGCSIVLAGIFGVILEWKSTRDYFGKRLSEIVLEDDYLKRLSKDRLRNLFLSIQRHIFDTDDVKKEGGFLDYFNRHLHGYIVQPYRENVSAEMNFSNHASGNLNVKDKISYRCREMNGQIQDFVQVRPEKDEFESWDYTKVTLGSGEFKETKEYQKAELDKLIKNGDSLRFDVPEKLKKDNLKVEIEQHYTIKKNKLQSWQMSHPTRGFKVAISYPSDLKIDTLPLLEIRDEATITNEPGYYGITYNEWMLPQSGITWTFE